jgi:SpoVK/Ycf46/Vps4 family AAA+-type ATPase
MALSNEQFFSKVAYNWMKGYGFNYADDMILKCLVGRMIDHEDHIPWITEYMKVIKAHEGNAEEEAKSGITKETFLTPHKIFTRESFDVLIAAFEEKAPYVKEPFEILRNTKVLTEILDMNENEALLFDLGMRISGASGGISYDWRAFMEEFRYKDTPFPDLYERLLGVPAAKLTEVLKGFVFQSGLLTPDNHYKNFYRIHADMIEAFVEPTLSTESLAKSLFPNELTSDLSLDLYPHLSKEIARAESVINRGLENKAKGLNTLLWGLPGTGKTELALTLAKKNNWRLIVVGDISTSDDEEKSRAQRLTSLKIAGKLFGRDENTVLLFDEMEDLFKMDLNAQFSKAFINRIIETTSIPIIWTTNSLPALGAPVLRRMVYNIEFDVPPTAARRVMWDKYAQKYGISLTPEALDDIATNFKTTPALIHNAVKVVAMAQLPPEELTEIVDSLNTLVNYGEKPKKEVTIRKDTPYDASCVNADIDVVKLSDQLKAAKPNFSVLLYGPAGTGKSEYARWIAKVLGKKVLFKRASDLQSMWVGECEKNIAKAFKEAADEEMVLIIDEGDSFLRNREQARASWEVSQVNEMLSQMEMHTQPFFLTTNLVRDLDPASMRRFTFKAKFDFMQPDQSARLFRQYFNVDAPDEIRRNDFLTPGDFANVKRKAEILGITDSRELYNLVIKECEVKKGYKVREMGFRVD